MSWKKISMKFQGTCIVCNGKIEANEIGFWSKGLGVKHEKCGEVKELKCVICGGPAGCPQCEFQEECDLSIVSQLCICKKCLGQNDPYASYTDSIKKKFPILNLN